MSGPAWGAISTIVVAVVVSVRYIVIRMLGGRGSSPEQITAAATKVTADAESFTKVAEVLTADYARVKRERDEALAEVSTLRRFVKVLKQAVRDLGGVPPEDPS